MFLVGCKTIVKMRTLLVFILSFMVLIACYVEGQGDDSESFVTKVESEETQKPESSPPSLSGAEGVIPSKEDSSLMAPEVKKETQSKESSAVTLPKAEEKFPTKKSLSSTPSKSIAPRPEKDKEVVSQKESKHQKIGLSIGYFHSLAVWGLWKEKQKDSTLSLSSLGMGADIDYRFIKKFGVGSSFFYNSLMTSKGWKREAYFDLINLLLKANFYFKVSDRLEMNSFLGLGSSYFAFDDEQSQGLLISHGVGLSFYPLKFIGINLTLSYLHSYHDKDLTRYLFAYDLGHVTGLHTVQVFSGASYHL